MPSTKPGKKEIRMVLDEGSETHETLLQWGENRGLTPGKATRVIMTNWAEAMNGKIDPFALATLAAAGFSIGTAPAQMAQASAPVEAQESPEEQARKAALLEAESAF